MAIPKTNTKRDVKGEFLAELIDRRNHWNQQAEIGSPDFEECEKYMTAYQNLIYAFTAPKPPKP